MTDNPESALYEYMRAFETLDPEEALPYYHPPCMFIARQGLFVVPDIDTGRTLLSQFMSQLRNQRMSGQTGYWDDSWKGSGGNQNGADSCS